MIDRFGFIRKNKAKERAHREKFEEYLRKKIALYEKRLDEEEMDEWDQVRVISHVESLRKIVAELQAER